MKNNKNNSIELLSPAGDFTCLKAAVQNGANSVYFGASQFSARSSATNFDFEQLKQAIQYAKIRNVKTNLTLNTLIKNDEFEEAIQLAAFAYENGIDAIIVQDLGLARYMIKNFPDLPVHASTQMTIYNLNGALVAEKLGFKRAVLARETPLSEIKNICANVNIEIETFIHGALCISYSGQCLLSSMIGGRSGNRGNCAQPCRLPYKLMNSTDSTEKILNQGYLLSTRDLCSLEYIPELINAGVKCFKIEGRMKPPEYVATVTRIYRKYIDLAQSDKPYIISESDKKELLQVFNRGGFSTGHLSSDPNKELVFKEKPNNMGLFLGTVHNFNSAKGYITFKTLENLSIGDTISLQNETGTYTISELIVNNLNSPTVQPETIVKIGRMKGNISVGDKIYKLSSKELNSISQKTFGDIDIKKIPLKASISIKKDLPICLTVSSINFEDNFYNDLTVEVSSSVLPTTALKCPVTIDRISAQLSKTGNTPFNFNDIEINLDDNLYIPNISCINELRRTALEDLQNQVITIYCTRKATVASQSAINLSVSSEVSDTAKFTPSKITILLNNLQLNCDYSNLRNVTDIYIPLKYFSNASYSNILNQLCTKFNVYVDLPVILKNNNINFDTITLNYDIKGFVISNISHLTLLDKFINCYTIIANYSFNVFNNYSLNELHDLGIAKITLSPELNKQNLNKIALVNDDINTSIEVIVYGKTPVMNINYCLLGNTNKCYSNCTKQCQNNNNYFLKDRLNFDFDIIPDNINSVTTIYNSKITCIDINDLFIKNVRIDFMNENLDSMQNVIDSILAGEKIQGQNYTNGNFNKEV